MGGIAFGADLKLGGGRAGGVVAAVPAFDFTAAALPAGATLSRGSAATRWNASGILVSEASNAARFDYDPATLLLRGLLIEAAATNRALGSSAFAAAPWNSYEMTVAADTATAPDGTGSADTLSLPAVTVTSPAQSQELYQAIADATSSLRAFSIWLKGASGGEQIGIECATSGGANFGWDGASRVLTLTNSWQRYVLLTTRAGTTYYPFIGADYEAIGPFTAPARTIHAWGAQLESGTRATSYIPTGGATVTRSGDVLTLDWAAKGVADGAIAVRYMFDDLSTQEVATTVSGGVATVPANLSRLHIRRAEKV